MHLYRPIPNSAVFTYLQIYLYPLKPKSQMPVSESEFLSRSYLACCSEKSRILPNSHWRPLTKALVKINWINNDQTTPNRREGQRKWRQWTVSFEQRCLCHATDFVFRCFASPCLQGWCREFEFRQHGSDEHSNSVLYNYNKDSV